MAQDRGKIVVPHCWKTGIGVAATAHFAAATSNCRYIEFLPPHVAESALRRELVQEELQIVDGNLNLPRRPGLGIELNSAAVRRFAKGAEDYEEARRGFCVSELP
jgi:L-alanine-DL-glutamate epimerase-like enolase superfamily enzyme